MEDINRIKVVLVEHKRTGKWLAEQLGKDRSTVSKWCSNKIQPDLSTLSKIAELLSVDIRELLVGKKYWPIPTYSDLLYKDTPQMPYGEYK